MEGSELLVTLMGGVALLLWSVRMVRTGMTRAFGASLRSLLGKACSNRAKAFAVGVGVTGLLQSATATALLLASFASRKLVTLPLALAIMLGADVGTALVAQVYSIDIKWIWAALLFIGVVLFNASEKDHIRGGGRILIGFGLMLLGLTIIGQVSGQLRDSPMLHLILSSLGSERVPLLAVLTAAAMTWLAHSSLAMVLFVMSLASGGAIDGKLAVALILGANLGGAIVPFAALVRLGRRRPPRGARQPHSQGRLRGAGAAVRRPAGRDDSQALARAGPLGGQLPPGFQSRPGFGGVAAARTAGTSSSRACCRSPSRTWPIAAHRVTSTRACSTRPPRRSPVPCARRWPWAISSSTC